MSLFEPSANLLQENAALDAKIHALLVLLPHTSEELHFLHSQMIFHDLSKLFRGPAGHWTSGEIWVTHK